MLRRALIFFHLGDNTAVVQYVLYHFEQSETTFRSPAKGKGNLAVQRWKGEGKLLYYSDYFLHRHLIYYTFARQTLLNATSTRNFSSLNFQLASDNNKKNATA